MEYLPSLVEYGFRRALITLIAIICIVLSVLGMSGADVAFPDIRVNLGASLDDVSWITIVYSFAGIIITPFCSWLSQKIGRRNYLVMAVILFQRG